MVDKKSDKNIDIVDTGDGCLGNLKYYSLLAYLSL